MWLINKEKILLSFDAQGLGIFPTSNLEVCLRAHEKSRITSGHHKKILGPLGIFLQGLWKPELIAQGLAVISKCLASGSLQSGNVAELSLLLLLLLSDCSEILGVVWSSLIMSLWCRCHQRQILFGCWMNFKLIIYTLPGSSQLALRVVYCCYWLEYINIFLYSIFFLHLSSKRVHEASCKLGLFLLYD